MLKCSNKHSVENLYPSFNKPNKQCTIKLQKKQLHTYISIAKNRINPNQKYAMHIKKLDEQHHFLKS